MAYVFRSAQYLEVLSERTHPACAAEADHSAGHGEPRRCNSAHEESHRIVEWKSTESERKQGKPRDQTCSMFAAAVSTRDVSYL